MTSSTTIRPRDRDALLQALRAGVVPRTGQYLIQVGRAREIQALLADIERVAAGGTAFRVVVGAYGSGKTFFLNQVSAVALEKKLVTISADLNPDRRLHATSGQARSLYAELMANMSTRSKPDGGALASVLEKFIGTVLDEARTSGEDPEQLIFRKCAALTEMVAGYDFAAVVAAYWRGHNDGNESLKIDAIRWMRGEFTTKTDARQALGVRTIVDDSSVYDHIKLMAVFVRLAGYSGLLVGLDELVNLYKLANAQSRNANYEQLLRILNDVLQGTVEGLGFLFGCTPDSLLDTRRGIYSYAALQSRLAENTFSAGGLVDYGHPVLRLPALTREDFFVLLEKIQHVHTSGDRGNVLLPEEGIAAFMSHCEKRVGEAYFRTPRTTITSFINLLALLDQYPDTPWDSLIQRVDVAKDDGGEKEAEVIADGGAAQDLFEFKL